VLPLLGEGFDVKLGLFRSDDDMRRYEPVLTSEARASSGSSSSRISRRRTGVGRRAARRIRDRPCDGEETGVYFDSLARFAARRSGGRETVRRIRNACVARLRERRARADRGHAARGSVPGTSSRPRAMSRSPSRRDVAMSSSRVVGVDWFRTPQQRSGLLRAGAATESYSPSRPAAVRRALQVT